MRISLFIVAALSILLVQGCKKEETKVTPSGYQYIVHNSTGGAKPNPGDYVYFHAQMRGVDTVYFASRDMGQAPVLQIPTEMDQQANANRPPSPVEEVLRDMAIGDSVTVIIRLDTMPVKPPGLEDVKEIYYDVVSVDIKDQERFELDAQKERESERSKREAAMQREAEVATKVNDFVKQYNSKALGNQLKTTSSGLKYMMLEEGSGKKAQAGKMLNVHYYGALTDGTMFDNSFSRGTPHAFMIGQNAVIPGYEEGVGMLKEGGKAILVIPPDLGYGAEGAPPSIPGNAELIFYIELEKAN